MGPNMNYETSFGLSVLLWVVLSLSYFMFSGPSIQKSVYQTITNGESQK
jgi:hypothetical protein